MGSEQAQTVVPTYPVTTYEPFELTEGVLCLHRFCPNQATWKIKTLLSDWMAETTWLCNSHKASQEKNDHPDSRYER